MFGRCSPCWICERPVQHRVSTRVKVREPNGYDATMSTYRFRAHSECVTRLVRAIRDEQDRAFTELPPRTGDHRAR